MESTALIFAEFGETFLKINFDFLLVMHGNNIGISLPENSSEAHRLCDAENSASLYAGGEANLGDRVLGEVEKDSFITLPGKGGHSGLLPQKLCPHLERIVSFMVMVQRGHGQLKDSSMGWW